MKKIISLLMTLAFILSLVPMATISVSAATAASEFTVEYASDGAYIVGFTGSSTTVSIPSTFNSTTLVGISDMAFKGTNVKTVSIPSTVKSIGNEAFANCSALTSVTIPSSVTTIGKGAFKNCVKLTVVSLPAIEKIDDFTFFGCTSLATVTMSNSTKEIGLRAFDSCALVDFEIGSGVTKIDKYAFMNCTKLEYIDVVSGNANYKSIEGALTDDTQKELLYVPAAIGYSYNVPSSITTIAKGAFINTMCSEITISPAVTTIADRAVTFSSSLTLITIPATVTSIGHDAFENSDNVVICCENGSVAHDYALDNDVAYEFLPGGDINGDGIRNAKDIVIIQKYVYYGGSIDTAVADMNGDGIVDEDDLVLLAQFIVGK